MDPKQRQHLLALAAMLCVGALIGDQLILTPLLNVWDERSTRIVELEESLQKGHVLVSREEPIKKRLADMKESALPGVLAVAENQILRSVDRWEQASRFRRTSMKLQWREFEDEKYRTLECRAAGLGSIETIARFLYELEKDPLPLKLEEVEMTARDESGGYLTLGIVFSGLQFFEEEQ